MKVKDIMTKPAVSVGQETTLKEVAALMAGKRFSGVPVVDEGERVVGVVTEADLLRYASQLSPVSLRETWGWVSPYANLDLTRVRSGLDLMASARVEGIMNRKVVTVSEDMGMEEAASLMTKRRINRLPVVDGQGRLVGIVTRADIVRAVAES